MESSLVTYNTSKTVKKQKYFEPFIRREYKKIFYVYFFNFKTGHRTKRSLKTTVNAQAIRNLKVFKRTYLSNQEQLNIKVISELRDLILNNFKHSHAVNTLKIYTYAFNYLILTVGDKPIRLLNFTDFEFFKNSLAETQKQTSVNFYIRHLRSGFSYARRMGLIEFNPVSETKQFKIFEERKRLFTDSELSLLIQHIDHLRIKQMVRFVILTGCRLGEVVSLQWKNIDYENNRISIFNKKGFLTKTRKDSEIPLTKNIKILLDSVSSEGENITRYHGNDEYIFAKKDGSKFSNCYVSRRFKKYVIQCGLNSALHFHTLRHQSLSILERGHVRPISIQKIARHETFRTTSHYLHCNLDEMRAEMEAVDYSMIGGIAEQ